MSAEQDPFARELERLSAAAAVSAERTAEMIVFLRGRRDQSELRLRLLEEVITCLQGRLGPNYWRPIGASEYWMRVERRWRWGRPLLLICSTGSPAQTGDSGSDSSSQPGPSGKSAIKLDPRRPQPGALLLFDQLAEQIFKSLKG